MSVSVLWSAMRNALTESDKELLGHRHRVHPDWFLESRDSLQPFADVRNQCYNDRLRAGRMSGDEHHMKFKSVRSAARTALRRAKNTWFQTYAEKLQTSCFDSAQTWACVRLFQSGKGGYASALCLPVRLETWDLCDSAGEQVQRWHRHFTSVLQLETSFHQPVIDALPQLSISAVLEEVPTMDELTPALSHLKTRKAAGESGILPGLVRCAGPAFSTALIQLFHRIGQDVRFSTEPPLHGYDLLGSPECGEAL